MPRIWPIVTTPVPPMPVTSIAYDPWIAGSATSGSAIDTASSATAPALPRRSRPPSTVTKLGQNPSTQEKSLFHDDWLIARLRPNSVSTGSIDTQFDFTPQSPQPSHTASLMNARFCGSGNAPRLRRRRFSAAQVWS